MIHVGELEAKIETYSQSLLLAIARLQLHGIGVVVGDKTSIVPNALGGNMALVNHFLAAMAWELVVFERPVLAAATPSEPMSRPAGVEEAPAEGGNT